MSQAAALALIREGWALHLRPSDPADPAAEGDPDLALLLGDRRYAAGLLELVRLGDLDAVRTMAGVISECARALAEGEPERAERAWAAVATG